MAAQQGLQHYAARPEPQHQEPQRPGMSALQGPPPNACRPGAHQDPQRPDPAAQHQEQAYAAHFEAAGGADGGFSWAEEPEVDDEPDSQQVSALLTPSAMSRCDEAASPWGTRYLLCLVQHGPFLGEEVSGETLSLGEAGGPLCDFLGCAGSNLSRGASASTGRRAAPGQAQEQGPPAGAPAGRRAAAGRAAARPGGPPVPAPATARGPVGYPPQRLQPPPGPSAGAAPQQGSSQGQQPALSGQQRAQQAAERAVRGTGNRQQHLQEAPSQSSSEPGNGDGPPPGGEHAICAVAWLLL